MKISEIEYHIHAEIHNEVKEFFSKRPVSEQSKMDVINLTNGILIKRIAELTAKLKELESKIADDQFSHRFDGKKFEE